MLETVQKKIHGHNVVNVVVTGVVEIMIEVEVGTSTEIALKVVKIKIGEAANLPSSQVEMIVDTTGDREKEVMKVMAGEMRVVREGVTAVGTAEMILDIKVAEKAAETLTVTVIGHGIVSLTVNGVKEVIKEIEMEVTDSLVEVEIETLVRTEVETEKMVNSNHVLVPVSSVE